MCRHLAYLGRPVSLAELLVEPESSLVRQSWAPRQQTHGVVNADGFGVGWYAEGDPVPARYRRDRPIWSDASFADLARVVRSGAVLAAVRSASPGMAAGEGAAAPFRRGRWLFSHNGLVQDWPESVAPLAATLPPERLLQLDAATDSALLWALVSDRLERGAGLGPALADSLEQLDGTCKGRFNFLLTDGHEIAATACGNSLTWRAVDGGVVVASEPYDDAPGWQPVPDRSLLVATSAGATVTAL
jgi:gamma-glutamyl hercynylcysteine S-oxide hydrolase